MCYIPLLLLFQWGYPVELISDIGESCSSIIDFSSFWFYYSFCVFNNKKNLYNEYDLSTPFIDMSEYPSSFVRNTFEWWWHVVEYGSIFSSSHFFSIWLDFLSIFFKNVRFYFKKAHVVRSEVLRWQTENGYLSTKPTNFSGECEFSQSIIDENISKIIKEWNWLWSGSLFF